METKELKVGDWVSFQRPFSSKSVVSKVVSIRGPYITLDDGYRYFIDHAKKITEEEAMLWKLKY